MKEIDNAETLSSQGHRPAELAMIPIDPMVYSPAEEIVQDDNAMMTWANFGSNGGAALMSHLENARSAMLQPSIPKRA